jgi:hypothetical protein
MKLARRRLHVTPSLVCEDDIKMDIEGGVDSDNLWDLVDTVMNSVVQFID